jgi:hypothetical protein
MALPLSLLLQTTAPQELERQTQQLDYVEKTTIFGAPAHHLAGQGEQVDYQIWVADGDRPLPQRIVLTYRNEMGQPQFRAQFLNWNLKPAAPAALFAFKPAPGMQRISFRAQLSPRAAKPSAQPARPAKPQSSGGSK